MFRNPRLQTVAVLAIAVPAAARHSQQDAEHYLDQFIDKNLRLAGKAMREGKEHHETRLYNREIRDDHLSPLGAALWAWRRVAPHARSNGALAFADRRRAQALFGIVAGALFATGIAYGEIGAVALVACT